MGVNVVDADVKIYRGTTLIRHVDKDVDGNVHTGYSAHGFGTRTGKCKVHRDSPTLDDEWSGTLDNTEIANMQGATSQSNFDFYASAAMGTWYNSKGSDVKAVFYDIFTNYV